MKRTAKILLSVLVILSILACLAACGSKGQPSGTYKIVSMEEDGMEFDAEMIEGLGLEISITFNSDGTGTLNAMGEKQEFEWKGNTMTVDGEESTFKLDGNKLTIEEDGTKMVFSK